MQDTKEINKVVYLSNNDILPNRFQPRKYFDEEEIMQLSESIKEHGVINPIIVRKLGDKYELVAGERRYKANILAGNDDIPAIIMDVNDKESSEIAVVENIQRKDLNAIEEAISYKRILDIGYMTQEKLAQKMGKSQAAIANKIRLLKLSDEVQDALMKKEISERHARSLLKLDSQKKQNEMLERIVKERLTVRKTDEEIDKMNNNMNVNFNNMYNNNANNAPNNITPVMPGTNVSDVNISGTSVEPTVNSPINPVEPITQEQIVPQPASPEPVVEQPITPQPVTPEPAVEQPTAQATPAPEVQTIPTLSIDDVLANANQPSVVGTQAFASNPNIETNKQNDSGIPNLTPINEEPTPISSLNNDNTAFNMPALSPINEEPISVEPQNNSIPTQEVPAMPADNAATPVLNNNPAGFEMPELSPISENPDSVDDFLNSINNPQTEPQAPTPSPAVPSFESTPAPETNINTFGNVQDENTIPSPINTSPIIDTTSPAKAEAPEDNFSANNLGIDANAMTQPQQQIEQVPEPIIVNDYNDQYDPIMPEQQNAQPTIDFKTIINLIRKCSQAIENSGYKIETEEYNLDNLYQVVFKIDKQ